MIEMIIWTEINNILLKLDKIIEKNELNQEQCLNLIKNDKEFNDYIKNISQEFLNEFIKDENSNNEILEFFNKANYEFMLYKFLQKHLHLECKNNKKGYLEQLYIFKKYINAKDNEKIYN